MPQRKQIMWVASTCFRFCFRFQFGFNCSRSRNLNSFKVKVSHDSPPAWLPPPDRPQLHCNWPSPSVLSAVADGATTRGQPRAASGHNLRRLQLHLPAPLVHCLVVLLSAAADEWATVATAGAFEWKLKIFAHKFATVWMNVSANKERAEYPFERVQVLMHLS